MLSEWMITYSSPGKDVISEGKRRFRKGERETASCYIVLYVTHTSKKDGSLYRGSSHRNGE